MHTPSPPPGRGVPMMTPTPSRKTCSVLPLRKAKAGARNVFKCNNRDQDHCTQFKGSTVKWALRKVKRGEEADCSVEGNETWGWQRKLKLGVGYAYTVQNASI
ncbi:hypothetical protein AAFF_G00123580 [Aldrovandia affinis]|uniref:Uncharacterized protein n=1 Tax=Aldrovandia affinis TaxID=143900 RepID=A0AAD7RS02_9TELE|nr:hypothetical protein AAFF_G00123580 [Aldrovandia affinis]